MSEAFKGRLNLSSKAAEALTFMVQQLKEENAHVQISQSKLCSWIVETYVRNYFSSDAPRIIQEHFNPKRYLTEMLKKATTGEEIKQLFDTAMLQGGKGALASSPKSKKRPVQAKDQQKSVEQIAPNNSSEPT